MLSLAGRLLLPLALVPAGGGHGCTEDVCRCAHRVPSRTAAKPCHGHEAAAPDCQISATCSHEQMTPLVAGPVYELPAVAGAAPPPEDLQALPAAHPSTVRHGFARLEPHPPPAL
jgi:hypothetical protein